jgi:hypothetical protein
MPEEEENESQEVCSHQPEGEPMSTFRASLLAALALAALAVSAIPASAAVPAYFVTTASAPTNLPPGGKGTVVIEAYNLGDAPAAGATSPIVMTDTLPPGLTATAVVGGAGSCEEFGTFLCEEIRGKFGSCQLKPVLRCELRSALATYEQMQMEITVEVAEHPPVPAVNEMTVSGGGAAGAVSRETLKVSAAPTEFGVEQLKLVPTNEDGSLDTQAGSHPFQLTSRLNINNAILPNSNFHGLRDEPLALTKDLHFNLPPGLVGNTQVIPQCTSQEFDELLPGDWNGCPADTAIGVAVAQVSQLRGGFTEPLFNLVPSPGEPARFGFSVLHVPIILDTAVRTGGDYGVVVSVNNISQVYSFFGSQVTFWGVPADPRHDPVRGWSCLEADIKPEFAEFFPPCVAPSKPKLTPFLTLPTSCTGPNGMRTTVQADSWPAPEVIKEGEYTLQEGLGGLLGLDGCNQLPFEPSIVAAPDGPAGSTPSGLTVGVHVPQEGALNPTGLSPADVKNTTVALPAGMQISPAGADGLEACSLAEIGLEEHSDPSCPDGSKVATAEIKTPLLPNPLLGEVYLAAQNANPFGSLIAMYIVVKDPVSGVLVKLAGQVSLDPVTGQLVSTFEKTPQLPFEDLTLHFFGSARAPLSTPASCGTYTTQASFVPWSGDQAVASSSNFEITSGPNGAPCSNPQPFAPGFNAESTNIQAGAFTPFQLTMSRPDADQTLSRIEMQMPPGLLGTLSNVKLCGEPQAAQGACGPESLIGETTVSVGLGNDPFTVTGGKVYITTAYGGGQYGLSIVNPAKAGPFDLENTPENHPACDCVVVRASISVDPHTAALSIKSDPLPTIIGGIPLQIQHVNVSVNREKFTFNPTNCGKTAINATLSSTQGVTAPVSTSFQVTNCANLAFKPKFTVSTAGKTSRANGASLHVKLTYPSGPYDANIARVKVDLPKQLPSRLTTLQKACTSAVFNTNPASCPAASLIGTATATTPVLPVPLNGPVYFVSHGGEAFPSLIIVLQGYGTTVDLEGSTFISKAGITSSTFKTVPDVPVGTFELTLPEGKYSALAANGNLCKSKLAMPTEFLAQNGAKINESTKISVTGCAKTKALTRVQKLTQALKACFKIHNKSKRAKCQRQAKRTYR